MLCRAGLGWAGLLENLGRSSGGESTARSKHDGTLGCFMKIIVQSLHEDSEPFFPPLPLFGRTRPASYIQCGTETDWLAGVD